jgi:hypothetical protein
MRLVTAPWALTLAVCLVPAVALCDAPTTDAPATFRLALELEAAGKAAEARAAYERVLAAEPDHLAARRALGFVRVDGRWLPRGEAEQAVAPAPAAAPDTPAVAAPSRAEIATRAVVQRLLDERDPAARKALVASAKRLDAACALDLFVTALEKGGDVHRVRAAEALGELGDLRAASALVTHWEARSGNFPRVYFAQMTQRSYIQDFDVEVASTSFIADPIVGVLQDGVVQSFKIHDAVHSFSSVERTALHSALVRLAGTDLGRTPLPWRTWLLSRT